MFEYEVDRDSNSNLMHLNMVKVLFPKIWKRALTSFNTDYRGARNM